MGAMAVIVPLYWLLITLQLQFAKALQMTCSGDALPLETLNGQVQTQVIGSATVSHDSIVSELDAGGSLGGRSYFGTKCNPQRSYRNTDFLKVPLAGKAISWDVDLSGVGCGCNMAFYLTSMRQNTDEGACGDYYCDANSVCGVQCAEVDLMEANMYAFHSTLHAASDPFGVAGGFGGGAEAGSNGTDGWSGPRDFTKQQYTKGSQSQCIDTSKPFSVKASFPLDARGVLKHLLMTLSQTAGGSVCELSFTAGGGYWALEEMTAALEAGMTPIVSYWSGDMAWMDGRGRDGQGACPHYDTPDVCKRHAGFSNFYVFENGNSVAAADDDGGGGDGDGSDDGDGSGSKSANDDGGNNSTSSAKSKISSAGPSSLVVALVSMACGLAFLACAFYLNYFHGVGNTCCTLLRQCVCYYCFCRGTGGTDEGDDDGDELPAAPTRKRRGRTPPPPSLPARERDSRKGKREDPSIRASSTSSSVLPRVPARRGWANEQKDARNNGGTGDRQPGMEMSLPTHFV